MLPDEAGKALSEADRQAVFAALVKAQDEGMGVERSRKFIAGHFGITEQQVRQIEREGLDNQWPPLS
jgi:hypothetical protein